MPIAFWKRRGMAEGQILVAASIIAENVDDESRQITALLGRGFSLAESHRLVAFLPLAFSRPIVEEFGAKTAPTVSVPTPDGGWITAELARQPEYVGALALARRHRRSGAMDQEIYRIIVESTSDIDALSNALNNGAELSGAVIASALVGDECSAHIIR